MLVVQIARILVYKYQFSTSMYVLAWSMSLWHVIHTYISILRRNSWHNCVSDVLIQRSLEKDSPPNSSLATQIEKKYESWEVLNRVLFHKAPSFEAREAHRYLNKRLGIFCARGGGLLDHPYAPCHPPSATPTEKHLGVSSYTIGIRSDELCSISLLLYCVSYEHEPLKIAPKVCV